MIEVHWILWGLFGAAAIVAALLVLGAGSDPPADDPANQDRGASQGANR